MRDTCLYCGAGEMVRIGHWNCCRFCSSDFIAKSQGIPEGYALVKKPELMNIGLSGLVNRAH